MIGNIILKWVKIKLLEDHHSYALNLSSWENKA